ncbi:MAG TPA: hypothetical protein VFA11_06480 [Acidimicrobiales bacterium]|nr:hypothetical protein [Acidimicrobiales bacterium]
MVRAHWGDGDRRAGAFPDGATLAEGRRGWVLCDTPERFLGGALAWGQAHRITELHLIAGPGAGLIARRARAFAQPPTVWCVDGGAVRVAEPEPLAPEPPLQPGAADLVGLITAAGATPVAEHGHLLAEVRGLEVGRVVPAEGGPVLEIGVGRFDRDARRELFAGLPHPPAPEAELARVVEDIRRRRVEGAPSHPARHLSPERWLRAAVVDHPELVGAAHLAPASPPLPRPDLLARATAPAVGRDGDGTPLVVVCSTGVDPELVPSASDARLAASVEGPDRTAPVRLAVVVPEGDDLPVTRRLAAALTEPAEVRTVGPGWRALAG